MLVDARGLLDGAKNILSSQSSHIHALELVPGDIVLAEDRIPADCRLLSVSSSNSCIDWAIPTGNSVSIYTSVEAVPDAQPIRELSNMHLSVCISGLFLGACSLTRLLR